MQEFNFLKEQFLSLQIPINEHYLDRYIKFLLSLPELKRKDEYCEKHHILPKSMFPQYENKKVAKWNQKSINAFAHYLCHWMLWRTFTGNQKMIHAFWGMSNQMIGGRAYKVNARAYSDIKTALWSIDRRKEQSERMKKANVTSERRAIHINTMKEYWTDETKRLWSETKSKEIWSDELKARVSSIQKARWSEEERKLQSDRSKLSHINHPDSWANAAIKQKNNQNRPWKNYFHKHNPKYMPIYDQLDKIYPIWILHNRPSGYKFFKILEPTYSTINNNIGLSIVEYFLKYGEPTLDEEWITSFR